MASPSIFSGNCMASRVILSIIIVNWNVRELARKCLLSIRNEMLLPADQYELIVVDNASSDGSADMFRAEFPDVSLIESPVNLGFGAGCNRAYAISRGEFILLLNPDTEVIGHAVDGLLAIMHSRPRTGVIAPRLVNADRSFQSAAGGALPTLLNVAWHYLFLRTILPARFAPPALFLEGDPREELAIGWVSGASMLLRRAAIGEQIFDESFFMFGEDMDACSRIRADGWKVVYAGGQSIIHHQGRSFDQQKSLVIRANAHKGPRRVFAKGRGPISVLLYDTIMFIAFLVRWPAYRVLSLLQPESGYDARALYSKSYLLAMLHDCAKRKSTTSQPDAVAARVPRGNAPPG